MRLKRILGLAAIAAVAAAGPSAAETGSRYRLPATGSKGLVATVHPLASEAGIAMLARGGNAVDAAVAAAFAVGVVRPEMCGPGGGGYLVYRAPGGRAAALDFRETAPARHEHLAGIAEAGIWAGDTGRNRVGVPATVAGLAAAERRLGRLSLSETIAPAERLAREGFAVGTDLSLYMTHQRDRLKMFPDTARVYLKDGRPYLPGERLVQPEYARSLRTIMDGGPRALYRGPIGDAIVDAMRAAPAYDGDQGFLAHEDLRDYRPRWAAPLAAAYRDAQVLAPPPSTSGGLALIEMLNLLEGFPLGAPGWGQSSANALHVIAEAQKIAWADRRAYVADPAFVDVPVERLTSEGYAAERRREIDMSAARADYPPAAPDGGDGTLGHTTHVSVIDGAGMAVSLTCSLGVPFGSAVIAPGTGFLLGSELADFGSPETVNRPEPGKRPRSSMTPAIVVRDGRAVLAAGAAGGSFIPLGVLNTIVNVLDFGQDPAHAIDAERIDARFCSDPDLGRPDPYVLCAEVARLRPDVAAQLAARGHKPAPFCPIDVALGGFPRCDEEYHTLPEVQAVGVTPTGERQAVSDPRGECGAAAEASPPRRQCPGLPTICRDGGRSPHAQTGSRPIAWCRSGSDGTRIRPTRR